MGLNSRKGGDRPSVLIFQSRFAFRRRIINFTSRLFNCRLPLHGRVFPSHQVEPRFFTFRFRISNIALRHLEDSDNEADKSRYLRRFSSGTATNRFYRPWNFEFQLLVNRPASLWNPQQYGTVCHALRARGSVYNNETQVADNELIECPFLHAPSRSQNIIDFNMWAFRCSWRLCLSLEPRRDGTVKNIIPRKQINI